MTMLQASEFVQRNARFVPDTPDNPIHPHYFVRFPKGATEAFFSNDLWDLVQRVFKRGNVLERRRKRSRKK